jgi:replicative DNA helicase
MASEERHIISPTELGTMGVETINALNESRHRLMPLLLPGLDDYFVPVAPGDLTIIQAQTHNGKSWFMRRWAERMVAHLKRMKRDEVIVWVDTETPANYLAMTHVSRLANIPYREIVTANGLDAAKLMRAAMGVAETPIYTVATRLGNDGSEIHLSNIYRALNMLVDGKVDGQKHRVAAVFIDYLQSLPYDPVVAKQQDLDKQRRLQVARDVNTCRVMGSRFSCPIILGVQAKQTPEPTQMYKSLGVPGGVYDGQETANIGQRTDRLLALAVAARNFGVGQVVEYHGKSMPVRENQMFVYVAKQRGEGFPAGGMFAYEMDSKAPDPMHSMAHLWGPI